MIITGMDHFQSVCKKKLVEWYNNNGQANTPQTPPIDLSNVFIVWSCKTLQNYKCLASTTVSGDGIYAEYAYNGDKQELECMGLQQYATKSIWPDMFAVYSAMVLSICCSRDIRRLDKTYIVERKNSAL